MKRKQSVFINSITFFLIIIIFLLGCKNEKNAPIDIDNTGPWELSVKTNFTSIKEKSNYEIKTDGQWRVTNLKQHNKYIYTQFEVEAELMKGLISQAIYQAMSNYEESEKGIGGIPNEKLKEMLALDAHNFISTTRNMADTELFIKEHGVTIEIHNIKISKSKIKASPFRFIKYLFN